MKRLWSSMNATRYTRRFCRFSTNVNRSVCQSWLGLARSKRRTLSGCGRVGTSSSCVARLVQHPRHRRGTGRQRRPAQEHVADPLAAPVRVRLLEHQDRPLGHLGQRLPGRAPLGWSISPAGPCGLELLLPRVERVLRHADQSGRSRRPAARCAARCPGSAAAARA